MFVEKKKKSKKIGLANVERLERRRIYSSSVEKSFSSWSIYGEMDDERKKVSDFEKALGFSNLT